ncbi:hypothetical protein [Lentzea californiensis]|uniref:hypothetical protein n=1 Tax=Lentzea californiensis TaxID=438851 RepID=UPI002164B802|nr:hypothetical protein [Lentzea californiensis]
MTNPRPSQAERHDTAGRILGWVGGKLLEDIGPDWARVDLKVLMAAGVDHYQYATLNQDGSVRQRALPAGQLRRPFSDLREVLWEQEKGTWFSVRFTIDPPGNTQTEYNFEVDPVWDPPIPPEVWAEDLEVFPRAEAWRPRWLRRELEPGLELPRWNQAARPSTSCTRGTSDSRSSRRRRSGGPTPRCTSARSVTTPRPPRSCATSPAGCCSGRRRGPRPNGSGRSASR